MNSKGTALITGASSGIGTLYADRLAKRGYDLILVARNEEKLKSVSTRITAETARSAQVISADLTNKEDLAQIEQLLRSNANITMLVNNAGMAIESDITNTDPERLENMIRLNVLAPSRLALAAIRGFLDRGHGTLINISSSNALAPELQINAGYSGSKAYMLNLSLRLQREVSNKGIRVQVVLPGAVRTDIWEKSGTHVDSLPQNLVMDVATMVDAALVGLDLGETVTIPSLPDTADWEAYETARKNLVPKLSSTSPAKRYTGAKDAN